MSDKNQPEQTQGRQPGRRNLMIPKPRVDDDNYKAAGKLKGRSALVTGGDSGIGRAVAIAFAKEGANVAIVYLEEDGDAESAVSDVKAYGVDAFAIKGDVSVKAFCEETVSEVTARWGGLGILVNNAAKQFPQESILDISEEQLRETFETNIFAYFFMIQAALPQMVEGDVIINTTSVTAYRGSDQLIDYSSTKGAIVTLTRSLSANLVEKGIRVNGVAPGPVWTPLIPATYDEEKVAEFGNQVPMKRAGQPSELAAAYVYLACDDSSYMTGQVLHVNGGEIIGG